MIEFTPLSLEEFNTLVADAEVLHSKNNRKRIFKLPDGSILKLFYGKSNLNRAMVRAKRFIQNCQRLKDMGLNALTPLKAYRCEEDNCIYVSYSHLPGHSLEHCLAEDKKHYLRLAANYIFELHNKGVYFRDLHPGNILCHDDELTLLDVQNINFHWFRVPLRRQIKNLTTFLYNRSFKALFTLADQRYFLNAYMACANYNPKQQQIFIKRYQQQAVRRRELLEW